MDLHLKQIRCGIPFAIQIFVGIGLFVLFLSRPISAQSTVTTKLYCSAPLVPVLFLTTKMPFNTAIFEKAIRDEVCEYNQVPVTVMPLRFVEKVETEPASVERYGYIWAVQLPDESVRYWFFWRAEHEALLKGMPGI